MLLNIKSSGYKITIFMWKLEAFTADIKHHKHHINKTNRKQLDRQTLVGMTSTLF
jgi:hypothetical protein